MEQIVKDILIQTGLYSSVFVLTLFIVSMLFRGFFWKYIKVRLSQGRLILIKRRGLTRDYFGIGEIKDGFLIFKDKKENEKFTSRLAISDKTMNDFTEQKVVKVLYRCLNINWVDIDEETNALSKCDYSPVSGFDSKKYSDLYVSCLQKPSQQDLAQRIIIICLCIVIVICIGGIIVGMYNQSLIKEVAVSIAETCKGTIIPVGA